MSHHANAGQKTTRGSGVCLSTVWVLRLQLRPWSLPEVPLPTESSGLPKSVSKNPWRGLRRRLREKSALLCHTKAWVGIPRMHTKLDMETRHHIAQVNLEVGYVTGCSYKFLILLLLSPRDWDYRNAPLYLAKCWTLDIIRIRCMDWGAVDVRVFFFLKRASLLMKIIPISSNQTE